MATTSELMEAVDRLERAIESSKRADAQRDDIQRSAAVAPAGLSSAMAMATGLAEGECAVLRRKAEVLCKLLRAGRG